MENCSSTCVWTQGCLVTHGPLARYTKLRVAHAMGMPGTFSPRPRVWDPYMHHGTCVTHVPWCMSGSLTSGFFWSQCRGKRSRHSRGMRNPQFYASVKRSMEDRDVWWPIGSQWTGSSFVERNACHLFGARLHWGLLHWNHRKINLLSFDKK